MLIENEFRYPLMLKLAGKECVLVGGGRVAARKLKSLLASGARTRIVAPEFCEELLCQARAPGTELVEDRYKREYIKDAFLVFAATDDAELNARICADAPLLAVNITEPELGNAANPASFREGNICVAVATGGMSAFARLLKKRLEEVVTPELAAFNEFLREQRLALQKIPSSPAERAAFWRRTLTEEVINLAISGDAARAKEIISDAIGSFRPEPQDGPGRDTRTL